MDIAERRIRDSVRDYLVSRYYDADTEQSPSIADVYRMVLKYRKSQKGPS